MSDLLLFLSVIVIFDATLFCGDFNSSRFLYSNVIITLINFLSVCGTFPFLVYTVIKLGHRMTYENCGAVNTAKQSFRTT